MAAKKTKKKNKNIVYIAAGAVIALIAVICLVLGLGSEANMTDKMLMPELNYETASKTSFHINGKNIFYCSKDGMRMLDEKGNTIWTDTYTMQQPVLIGDGEYAAVAEERGRVVRVYDTSGLIYEINAENPITTFTVNQKGYTAVIMEMPNEYLTNIYNSLGSVVSISSCPVSESIPVAITVSDDSSVYATSYIETNAVTFKSNVVMRYVGKEKAAAAETIDGMFTAFSGGDGIVGKLEFSGENALTALSDKELILADVSAGSSTEKLRTAIEGVMTAVDIGENGTVAIAFRGENGGNIKCYSRAGKETASFATEQQVNYIKVYNDIIIAVSGAKIDAYDYGGGKIWSVITGQDVKQAFLFSSNNELIIAGSNKMRALRVKKGETVNEGVAAENGDSGVEIVTEELTEAPGEQTPVTTAAPVENTAVSDDNYDDEDGSYDNEEYSDSDEDDYSDDEEYYDDEDDYSDDEEYYDDEDDYSDDDEEYYDDEEDYNDNDYDENEE